MASDERAFIRAILGNPYDYTPRLVYADWLEEHGKAGRAYYIRAGVSWEICVEAGVESDHKLLMDLEKQCMRLQPYACPEALKPYQPVTRAGMVEELTVCAEDFLPLAASRVPLRQVNVMNMFNDKRLWSKVLTNPLLPQLENLIFDTDPPLELIHRASGESADTYPLMNETGDPLCLVYTPTLTRLAELRVSFGWADIIQQEINEARRAGLPVLPKLKLLGDAVFGHEDYGGRVLTEFAPLPLPNVECPNKWAATLRAQELNPAWGVQRGAKR